MHFVVITVIYLHITILLWTTFSRGLNIFISRIYTTARHRAQRKTGASRRRTKSRRRGQESKSRFPCLYVVCSLSTGPPSSNRLGCRGRPSCRIRHPVIHTQTFPFFFPPHNGIRIPRECPNRSPISLELWV